MQRANGLGGPRPIRANGPSQANSGPMQGFGAITLPGVGPLLFIRAPANSSWEGICRPPLYIIEVETLVDGKRLVPGERSNGPGGRPGGWAPTILWIILNDIAFPYLFLIEY